MVGLGTHDLASISYSIACNFLPDRTFLLTEPIRSQNAAWLSEGCDWLQQGDASAAQEAEVWQQNAASWSDALLQQHPLYRDVIQPVGLAVCEVRCGLSLMVHAAAKKADQELANSTLADCMAFPSSLGQGEEDLLHHAMCSVKILLGCTLRQHANCCCVG